MKHILGWSLLFAVCASASPQRSAVPAQEVATLIADAKAAYSARELDRTLRLASAAMDADLARYEAPFLAAMASMELGRLESASVFMKRARLLAPDAKLAAIQKAEQELGVGIAALPSVHLLDADAGLVRLEDLKSAASVATGTEEIAKRLGVDVRRSARAVLDRAGTLRAVDPAASKAQIDVLQVELDALLARAERYAVARFEAQQELANYASQLASVVDGVGRNPVTPGTPAPEQMKVHPALGWAETIESDPDPRVVTDSTLLAAIRSTGLPWRVRDRLSKIELLLVPPGSFTQGASTGEGTRPDDLEASDDARPAHLVRITRAFYLGRYEVTQRDWSAVQHTSPSLAKGELYPVEQVSWDDICGSAGFLEHAAGLRLPTEAEWEYACRAGTRGPRYGELEEIAWCGANADCKMHPVGGKLANALGFHDMLGNVTEWCGDFYSSTEYSRVAGGGTDPNGPGSGKERVLRGGGVCYGFEYTCRAFQRNARAPSVRTSSYGFRVARTP